MKQQSDKKNRQRKIKIFRDLKTYKILNVISCRYDLNKLNRTLVIGCGTGIEAAIIAQQLDTDVIGIDINNNFNLDASRYADLRKGDATSLNYEDEFFDFVYCYHVLEHISEPYLALREIKRVLKVEGRYFIGTPNRLRLVGYIGSKDAQFKQKILWNIKDWKERGKGKFRNEYGAHAGFSPNELKNMLKQIFLTCEEITNIYYSVVYRKYLSMIQLIAKLKLSKLVFPSVYFIGKK